MDKNIFYQGRDISIYAGGFGGVNEDLKVILRCLVKEASISNFERFVCLIFDTNMKEGSLPILFHKL